MLNSKNRVFNPYFFNRYLSNEKNNFADNSSVEPAIFLMEKLSFSMKLFSGHFYGQSFIKTVRGPYAPEAKNGLAPGVRCLTQAYIGKTSFLKPQGLEL